MAKDETVEIKQFARDVRKTQEEHGWTHLRFHQDSRTYRWWQEGKLGFLLRGKPKDHSHGGLQRVGNNSYSVRIRAGIA